MTEIKPTKDERITSLEVQVASLQLQVRALLRSHESTITQNIELANLVGDMAEAQVELERKFHRHLVARQAQLVLDLLDDEGMPTFEDVQYLDESVEGQPVSYTEPTS